MTVGHKDFRITKGKALYHVPWWKRWLMPWFFIETLEGTHRASPGDWIIKGVAGEFYPCKPDIFAATYNPLPQ